MRKNLENEIDLLHNRICSGISDPMRVLILYELEQGSRSVGELVEALGVLQPAMSRHLRVLRERRLVTTERHGASIFYSLADHRVLDALNLLRAVLATQIEAETKAMRGSE